METYRINNNTIGIKTYSADVSALDNFPIKIVIYKTPLIERIMNFLYRLLTGETL